MCENTRTQGRKLQGCTSIYGKIRPPGTVLLIWIRSDPDLFPDPEISSPNPDPDPALVVLKKNICFCAISCICIFIYSVDVIHRLGMEKLHGITNLTMMKLVSV
jgi:hypothetical protein